MNIQIDRFYIYCKQEKHIREFNVERYIMSELFGFMMKLVLEYRC